PRVSAVRAGRSPAAHRGFRASRDAETRPRRRRPSPRASGHVEQRAVAAEARAERRHPPPARARPGCERGFEHEVDERAAEVAELAQYGRAVLELLLGKSEPILDREQHVAPARVPNPLSDVGALEIGLAEHPVEYLL